MASPDQHSSSSSRLPRDSTRTQVFVGGKDFHVDGAILVWGAATERGRTAATALGIADVLTAEDMVNDLRIWQPSAWQDFITQRRSGLPSCSTTSASRVVLATRNSQHNHRGRSGCSLCERSCVSMRACLLALQGCQWMPPFAMRNSGESSHTGVHSDHPCRAIPHTSGLAHHAGSV
jgi:hypothetical protein